MLEHGGRLRRAAQHYGIAVADWVDLSTGINPNAYPAPAVPASAWQRLPEDDDGLDAAAAAYYGSSALLAVAGSQPAIQALPAVLSGARVSLLAPSYAEHAHAWRARTPHFFAADADAAETAEAAVDASDIVVLVQPNNPTGALFARSRLLDWHARLARRGGWLVVDEAFIDPTPDASLAPMAGADGLVVLRSLGKFFGLAGARVGFVLAPAAVRAQLAEQLGHGRSAARHAMSHAARWPMSRGRPARARSSGATASASPNCCAGPAWAGAPAPACSSGLRCPSFPPPPHCTTRSPSVAS